MGLLKNTFSVQLQTGLCNPCLLKPVDQWLQKIQNATVLDCKTITWIARETSWNKYKYSSECIYGN